MEHPVRCCTATTRAARELKSQQAAKAAVASVLVEPPKEISSETTSSIGSFIRTISWMAAQHVPTLPARPVTRATEPTGALSLSLAAAAAPFVSRLLLLLVPFLSSPLEEREASTSTMHWCFFSRACTPLPLLPTTAARTADEGKGTVLVVALMDLTSATQAATAGGNPVIVTLPAP
jgi:hypothetical protein